MWLTLFERVRKLRKKRIPLDCLKSLCIRRKQTFQFKFVPKSVTVDVNFALSIYFIYPWLMEAKLFAIIIREIASRLLKTKSIFHIFCNSNHITMFASISFVVSLSSSFAVVFKNFLPCHLVEYWVFSQVQHGYFARRVAASN